VISRVCWFVCSLVPIRSLADRQECHMWAVLQASDGGGALWALFLV